MTKINYGCGGDYREGWINIDISANTKWRGNSKKPDLVVAVTERTLPMPDNSVDYILADNVIEHMERQQVEDMLSEFHRVLKCGGVLDMWVPHFTGIAVKFLDHVRGYGVDSFCFYKDRFDIKQELWLVSRYCLGGWQHWARWMNFLNPLFNWSSRAQGLSEKFVPGGFEEIHYLMTKKG